MKANPRSYKVFDQSEAIEKAKKVLNKIKKQHSDIKYIRLDADTIIGIKATRKNTDAIINKFKNKPKKISIVEQIEYGHYA